jgi:hypothetical protein
MSDLGLWLLCLMPFSTIFQLLLSWRLVLSVDGTGVPGENYRRVHIIVLPISSRSELLNPLEQNLLLTSGQRRTFDNSNLTNIDDSHLGRTDRIGRERTTQSKVIFLEIIRQSIITSNRCFTVKT